MIKGLRILLVKELSQGLQAQSLPAHRLPKASSMYDGVGCVQEAKVRGYFMYANLPLLPRRKEVQKVALLLLMSHHLTLESFSEERCLQIGGIPLAYVAKSLVGLRNSHPYKKAHPKWTT